MRNLIPICFGLLCLAACGVTKEATLFEAPPVTPVPENVKGFYAVHIFDEELTNDFWGEENPVCFEASLTKEGKPYGTYALEVKWNKDIGACDWIGMGFGWDGWMAKDMQSVFDSVALSMKAKPKSGDFGNLPVALAFEDYAGKQAWLGFTQLAVVPEKSENGWTHIELPLSEFNWAEQGANPANIKQLIIQLEATGEFLFDEIKIIERVGGFDRRYNARFEKDLNPNIDGELDEEVWVNSQRAKLENGEMMIAASETHLFLAGEVKDMNPGQNANQGDMIWDGDAVEFAFRSQARKDLALGRLSSVDRHMGVSTGQHGSTWLFTAERKLNSKSFVKVIAGGYQFEVSVSWDELEVDQIELFKALPMELAIDDGTLNGRVRQTTWNSPNGAEFHRNPSVWGELVFIPVSKKPEN